MWGPAHSPRPTMPESVSISTTSAGAVPRVPPDHLTGSLSGTRTAVVLTSVIFIAGSIQPLECWATVLYVSTSQFLKTCPSTSSGRTKTDDRLRGNGRPRSAQGERKSANGPGGSEDSDSFSVNGNRLRRLTAAYSGSNHSQSCCGRPIPFALSLSFPFVLSLSKHIAAPQTVQPKASNTH